MKFLQQLSESKLFPSDSSYKRYTGVQIAEMIYLHIIALQIISADPLRKDWAKDYAHKCTRYAGFAKWYQNATDLHLLLHVMDDDNVELRKAESSRKFIDSLYYNEPQIKAWFKAMANQEDYSGSTRKLFVTLDSQFKIKDSSLRAIRRLAQDWDDLDKREKQLCITRLLQVMRVRCRQSDLLKELEMVARDQHLELHDVCNLETGHGCEADEPDRSTTPKKSSSWLSKLAAGALGGYIGYKLVQPHKPIREDDGGAAPAASSDGGVTTAADIAPVIKPLGGVKKRND